MTRVKLCGITNAADRDAAIAAGADAIGVVSGVTVDTPREVDLDRAADLLATVPPFVTSVLVTMPDSVATARDRLAETGADAIQVHGEFSPAEVRNLTPESSVIRAVDAANPEEARRFDGVADAILVDSTDADGGGGTGSTHDWDRTRDLRESLETPLVLAGGLTPANVAEAVRTVEPHAVDVASGVEVRGGEKDHDALGTFVDNATGRQEASAR